VLQGLIPPRLQEQMIQGIAQQTGMNPTMVQAALPSLIPVVMNILNMGSSTTGQAGGNSILQAFLAGDRTGNIDLGEMLQFANRFLNSPS
jgi:hypothetical protein